MTLDRPPDDRKPLLVPARPGAPRLTSSGGAARLGAWRRQRRSPSNAPAARPSSRSTPSCAPSSPTSRRRRRARSPTSAPRSTSCARAPPRSRSASSRAWRRRARRARSSTGSSRRGSRRPRTRPTRRSAPSTTSRMADDLLRGLLRQVSRSFYLSLAILPRPLREPIGLAYLLARAADTVADTRLIKCEGRLGHLETLRRACAGEAVDVGTLARACASQQAPAERVLLERVGEALDRVEALAPADRHEVRAVLATLTSGMIFDLTRFPGEDSKGLAAIETLEELEHYTYLVAGCVGPFWTVLHVAHRRRLSDWALREMSERGVSFG